jgi:hypothetical protein
LNIGLAGTQRQHLLLADVEVRHVEVQVRLLGLVVARPHRGPVARRALESQRGAAVAPQLHPLAVNAEGQYKIVYSRALVRELGKHLADLVVVYAGDNGKVLAEAGPFSRAPVDAVVDLTVPTSTPPADQQLTGSGAKTTARLKHKRWLVCKSPLGHTRYPTDGSEADVDDLRAGVVTISRPSAE